MRVLIAGCGQVGTSLAEALIRAGHSVWGVRRAAEKLPQTFDRIAADLTQPETLVALPPVDVLVYAAAADAPTDAAYDAAYTKGLTNVLAAPAMRRTPPVRILFTSTTAVYGQQDGEWVDETSPTEPNHFSGLRTLQAETLLHAQNSTTIAVRCGGIYGPGRTRLLERISDGEASYTPGTPIYTNRIHIDDVVGALIHLIQLDHPEPVYNCVDDDPADLRLVLEYLADRLGAPAPRKQLEPETSRQRRTNKRCTNRRLRESGYVLRYSTFREGYASLLSRA